MAYVRWECKYQRGIDFQVPQEKAIGCEEVEVIDIIGWGGGLARLWREVTPDILLPN
jgi:hypothetical protein